MRGPRDGFAQTLVLGLAILGAEWAAAAAYAIGAVGISEVLWVRLASIGAALAMAALMGRAPDYRGLNLQTAIWVAIGGPLGACVAVLLILLGGKARKKKQSFGDWIDDQIAVSNDSEADQLASKTLDERLRIEGASDTQALVDILDSDDQRAKLRALSVMARHYDSALLPAMRTALKDTDAAVRVMAASVFAMLQKNYADRAVERQREAEADPANAQAWLRLAQAHITFARSGLLSVERFRDERETARTALLKAAELATSDDAIRLQAGQGLADLGFYQEALTALDGAFGDEFTSARAQQVRVEARACLVAQEAATAAAAIRRGAR